MTAPPARRVAVVGAGPRAAYALERVTTLAGHHGLQPPEVDVIGPGADLGPGEVYAADQPDWLRLNVASGAVHAWRGADPQLPAGGPSFDQWREQRATGSTADQFPPRSLVGRYLAEMGDQVRGRLPGRRRSGRVTSLRRQGARWEVQGPPLDDSCEPYDEVLLASGHAADWPGALRHGWAGPVPLVPAVFPVSDLRDRVEDRDGVVVIRGAALTAIDAVLALTLERRHQPRLLLVSRTGRLMTPKPEPHVVAAIAEWEPLLAEGRRLLEDPATPVAQVLCQTAQRLYDACHRHHQSPGRPRAVEEAAASLLGPAPRSGAVTWLAEQVAISAGEAPPDGSWALGQAWRGLHPALVARQDRIADTCRAPLGWPALPRWAAALERVAFGPPPVNARRLLGLLETGQVEVRATGEVADLALTRGAVAVVDAVLPPPGLRGTTDPLLRQLLANGAVAPHPRSRGMRVTADARCRGTDGEVTPGLSAVGRVTEDVVLGNDTLVRAHHPHLDRWARRILGLDEGTGHG